MASGIAAAIRRLCLTHLHLRNIILLAAAVALSSGSYLYSLKHNSWGDPNAKLLKPSLTAPAACASDFAAIFVLDFGPHHTAQSSFPRHAPVAFESCEEANLVPRGAAAGCVVPAPAGYRTPLPWPASREVVWKSNVAKAASTATTVRAEGEKLLFFDAGVTAYLDKVERIVGLRGGAVRTALDIDCGVASLGAILLSRGVLTMSLSSPDTDGFGAQLALERGVPAMLGELSASRRLPFPAMAFDIALCADCTVPWLHHDGVFIIEMDRVLRPGGYWIVSGQLVDQEKGSVAKMAAQLCWEKVGQHDDIAVWRKPINHARCKASRRATVKPNFCRSTTFTWYDKLDDCITPMPSVSDANEVAGGELAAWPARMSAVPPRILIRSISGVTREAFLHDGEVWKRRVGHYKTMISRQLMNARYRSVLDMNAHLGGLAAALADDPVWVMNVVPAEVTADTLSVIYDRGLIGTYHNWCVAMPTYPRTYDLIHANNILTLYKDRCNVETVLLEMDRILRPGGTVIIRDDASTLAEIRAVVDGLSWDTRIVEEEDVESNRKEKLMVVAKTYWSAIDDDEHIH